MRLDQFNNPIFNDKDIFEAFYKGQSVTAAMFVELSNDVELLEQVSEIKFTKPYLNNLDISNAEYDIECQRNWFMPDEYCPNLVEFLYGKCHSEEERNRVSEELEAFIQHGMYDLLHYLKYMVDTLEKSNVLWGVGRGSSVASFVLYLLGVHSIDSIKYNLDWREFLR